MGSLLRRLKYTLAADMIDLALRTTPLLDGGEGPPRWINFSGGGDFRQVGDGLAGSLVEMCRLRDGERVLDVGCGIGRAAVALSKITPGIQYIGFDIVPFGITWCNKRFRSWPNFRFLHADLRNEFYNPRGKETAGTFRFPCSDQSVDVALATSVFTHMREMEMRWYLREIRRCLDVRGRAFITCFVVDAEARTAIAEGRAALTSRHHLGPRWVETLAEPELAVGIAPDVLAREVSDAGLEWASFHRGGWRGERRAEFQDALVLHPRI